MPGEWIGIDASHFTPSELADDDRCVDCGVPLLADETGAVCDGCTPTPPCPDCHRVSDPIEPCPYCDEENRDA